MNKFVTTMRGIVFRSDQFQPYLPDNCQVNPNVLGFELAHWLSVELAKAGVVTSYPISEDWGWFLEHRVGGREYLICCGGYENEGPNADAAVTSFYEWKIFVEPPRAWFHRPKTDGSDVHALMAAIETCLADARISYEIEE